MATVIDALFQIRDNVDPTKVAMFQVEDISHLTTRTFRFQDRDGTLALLDDLVGLDHGGLTGLGDDDHPNYLQLAGRVGGMTGTWLDTLAAYFTLNTGRASTDAPLAASIWRFRTSDSVTIFDVQDDGATTINVPYNTYASGNPIALSLEMADATVGGTFFRIRTNGTNVFTISYHGGTAITMTSAATAFIITPFSTTSNALVIRNSALATTVQVSDQGVTSIIPSHTVTATPGLVVQRSSAAACVIAEFRNNAGAATVRVDAVGRLIAGANSAGATLSFTSTGALIAVPSAGGTAGLASIFSQTTGWNGGSITNGLWRLEPTLSDPGGVGTPGVGPTTMFRINATVSDAAGVEMGIQSNVTISDNSGIGGGGGSAVGLEFNANSSGTGNLQGLIGVQGTTLHASSGTLAGIVGGQFFVRSSGGNITNAYALKPDVLYSAGTITNHYSCYVGMPTVSGSGQVTTAVGLYIEGKNNGPGTPITTSYAIKADGGQSQHVGSFHRAYAPSGAFPSALITVATGFFANFSKRFTLTQSQRIALEGDARMVIQ